MDDVQFQQFMNALAANRGSMKPPKLDTLDINAWKVFRENFTLTSQANNWGVARAKQMCKASLTGEAALSLHDIGLGGDDLTLNGLMDLYEARVMAPAASATAEHLFNHMSQNPAEEVLAYHTRCRQLASRAFPHEANLGVFRPLITNFIKGLSDPDVRMWTRRSNPIDYAAALAAAQLAEATALAEHNQNPTSSSKIAAINLGEDAKNDNTEIFAIPGDKSNQDRKCWFPLCSATGHIAKHCPKKKLALEYFKKTRSGSGPAGKPQTSPSGYKRINFKSNYFANNGNQGNRGNYRKVKDQYGKVFALLPESDSCEEMEECMSDYDTVEYSENC